MKNSCDLPPQEELEVWFERINSDLRLAEIAKNLCNVLTKEGLKGVTCEIQKKPFVKVTWNQATHLLSSGENKQKRELVKGTIREFGGSFPAAALGGYI